MIERTQAFGEKRTLIRHARAHPEQSLGVATFSVAQRQTILKELELQRRASPDTEEFFAATAMEPFFVKNLENIQGDERDVIFISIGYGKTEQGYSNPTAGSSTGSGVPIGICARKPSFGKLKKHTTLLDPNGRRGTRMASNPSEPCLCHLKQPCWTKVWIS